MKTGKRVRIALLSGVWAASLVAMTEPAVAQSSRPVNESGFSGAGSQPTSNGWNGVSTALLTPDGKWFVYQIAPEPQFGESAKGPVAVVARSIADGTERRFAAGDVALGAGGLTMSSSGRWLAFRSARQPQNAAVLVAVENGRSIEFGAVQEVLFVGGGAYERLLLKGYPDASRSGAFDLRILDLANLDREPMRVRDVYEYAISPPGTRLALASSEGLSVIDVRLGNARRLDSDGGARYQTLTWSDRGNALAALRAAGGEKSATPSLELWAATGLEKPRPNKFRFTPGKWPGFPDGYEISSVPATRTIYSALPALLWREDEWGLFFSVRRSDPPPGPPAGGATHGSAPNLVLWHVRDQQLPREKAVSRGAVDLAFVSLADSRYLRLSDETLRDVQPHARARFLLGYDVRPYGWMNPGYQQKASQARDYYLVDISSGKRTLLERELRIPMRSGLSAVPQLSPDGSTVLYQNNAGDYVAYDVVARIRRNLTASLPTRFYFKENSPELHRQPRASRGVVVLAGWTSDSSHVLLSDYYDIWSLPLKGGRAENLTRNGLADQLAYRLVPDESMARDTAYGREDFVDLHGPIYFSFVGERNARSGLVRYGGRSGVAPELLYSADAGATYLRATHADVVVASISTSTQPEDYYLLRKDAPPLRLTDVNPLDRQSPRWPGSIFLSYTTSHGDHLRGSLHLPVAYEKGQTYPAIVQIYEEAMSSENYYLHPDDQNIGRWLKRGYAVIRANVRPRFNEAGAAAVEAVRAAVEAAVATGVVDRERLGLTGHSYGGYETYFVAARSNLFKAVIPESGLTNLWSMYGGVVSERFPTARVMENQQPFMMGPWWDNWDAFLQNSPLFFARDIRTPMLMVHGSRDTAVPFSQAVELFNALRRMGNSQTVLLEYEGEGHLFGKVAQADIDRRMEEFFDHFLRGLPAPEWWDAGLSHAAGQAPPARAAR